MVIPAERRVGSTSDSTASRTAEAASIGSRSSCTM